MARQSVPALQSQPATADRLVQDVVSSIICEFRSMHLRDRVILVGVLASAPVVGWLLSGL